MPKLEAVSSQRFSLDFIKCEDAGVIIHGKVNVDAANDQHLSYVLQLRDALDDVLERAIPGFSKPLPDGDLVLSDNLKRRDRVYSLTYPELPPDTPW